MSKVPRAQLRTSDGPDWEDANPILTVGDRKISKVYLSGRITGEPDHGQAAFAAAAKSLRGKGLTVMSPAETDHGSTDKSRDYYMRIDLQYVVNEADAIVVLPNWKNSIGARCEVMVGLELGLPILDLDLNELSSVEVKSSVVDHDETIADEAMRLVYGDRNDSYGHPLYDFSRTALILTAILLPKLQPGAMVTPEEIALAMTGVKISREVNKPSRDNLVDAIGYILCLDKIRKKRVELENG